LLVEMGITPAPVLAVDPTSLRTAGEAAPANQDPKPLRSDTKECDDADKASIRSNCGCSSIRHHHVRNHLLNMLDYHFIIFNTNKNGDTYNGSTEEET
jgi:hypothetical protein